MASAVRQPFVVLDDDPTGVQTLAGIRVLLSWDADRVRAALAARPSVHLITNTRALSATSVRAFVAEAARVALEGAPDATVVLRGDSTLRGHVLEEYLGVRDVVAPSGWPVLLLVPALPSAGRVTIDGVDVRDVTRASLLEVVTPVLQRPSLFSGTLETNIAFGASSDDGAMVDVVTAARAAEAAGFIEDRPDGYRGEVKRRGANLSGGQRQRLSIARALVRRPTVLILDDTTSALDVATEARVQDAIRGLMGDSTVFLVAQRISAVLTADVIVVLEEGRIVAKGAHAELLRSSPEYRSIYESQLGAVPEHA